MDFFFIFFQMDQRWENKVRIIDTLINESNLVNKAQKSSNWDSWKIEKQTRGSFWKNENRFSIEFFKVEKKSRNEHQKCWCWTQWK